MEQFGYFVLLAWLPFTIVLFARLRPPVAAAIALFGAEMFLPERLGFDMPAMPKLDKEAIGAFSVLVGAAIFAGRRLKHARFGRRSDLLWVLLLIGQLCTTFANGDRLSYGPTQIPGLRMYDAISFILRDLFVIGLPYFLSRALFRSVADLVILMRIVVALGLLYSLLALIEVRFSPQLHNWFYGFFPHSFGQTKRWGGFRPQVFMEHGLDLARFFFGVTVIAGGLHRMKLRVFGIPAGLVLVYMCGIVLVAKSTGVWFYAALCVPLVAFGSVRSQLGLALVLVVIVGAFPLLRTHDLVPTKQLVAMSSELSVARAQSLQFRFDQEEMHLKRALQRPIFGWGGWSRHHVYDEHTGRNISVTDGLWVKVIGMRGLFGFVVYFGMLLVPIWTAARRLRAARPSRELPALAALILATSVMAVDLLPNGLHDYFMFVLSGALAGFCEGLVDLQAARARKRRSPARARAAPELPVVDVSAGQRSS